MNSLVFSYFIDAFLITVRHFIILVFKFIMDCTDPVDRYHSKCLLAKRICKTRRMDYKIREPYNTLSVLWLVKKPILLYYDILTKITSSHLCILNAEIRHVFY